MSRFYTVTLSNAAVTQAANILQLPISASQCVRLVSGFIGQSSDAGDANAAMLRAVIHRVTGTVTNGTGGAAATPRPIDTAFGAFSGTVRMGDVTTLPTTAGTKVILCEETWNVQAGWYLTPTPEERYEFSPSETIWISICDSGEDFADATPDAIGNPITVSARFTFEVIGAL